MLWCRRHLLDDTRLQGRIVGLEEQQVGDEILRRLPIVRALETLHQLRDAVPQLLSRDEWRVHSDNGEGQVRMARGDLERDHPTHAVSDDYWLRDADLLAQPGNVVGELGHGVVLLRFVALP